MMKRTGHPDFTASIPHVSLISNRLSKFLGAEGTTMTDKYLDAPGCIGGRLGRQIKLGWPVFADCSEASTCSSAAVKMWCRVRYEERLITVCVNRSWQFILVVILCNFYSVLPDPFGQPSMSLERINSD